MRLASITLAAAALIAPGTKASARQKEKYLPRLGPSTGS